MLDMFKVAVNTFVLMVFATPFFSYGEVNMDSVESFRDSSARYCLRENDSSLKIQCVKDFARRFELLNILNDTRRGRELISGCETTAQRSAYPYQALLICAEFQYTTQLNNPFPELAGIIHESYSLRNAWLSQCPSGDSKCYNFKEIAFSEFWDELTSLSGTDIESSTAQHFKKCLPLKGSPIEWDYQNINLCLHSN